MCRLVPGDIGRTARVAVYHTKEYLAALTKVKAAKQRQETDKYKWEQKKTERRLSELDKILNKFYEDSALGWISGVGFEQGIGDFPKTVAAAVLNKRYELFDRGRNLHRL